MSSRSIPTLVRDHAKAVHSISEHGIEHSSIMERLQDNVGELLMYKEELISLNAKLKVSQETQRLQNAEFAFRTSQYEADIEQMRQRENDLVGQIAQSSQERQKIDVDVQINRNDDVIGQETKENYRFREKCAKWKGRYREIRDKIGETRDALDAAESDNRTLRKQLHEIARAQEDSMSVASANDEMLRDRLKQRKAQNAALTFEVARMRDELSEIGKQRDRENQQASSIDERYQHAIDDVTCEKADIERKLMRANEKIAEQQQVIDSMDGQHTSAMSESQSHVAELEQANTELKTRAKSLMTQLDKMRSVQDLVDSQRATLEHVEVEHDNIMDALGLEVGESTENWSLVTSKIEALVAEVEELRETKMENEKLERRLKAALDESRRKATQVTEKTVGGDAYLKMVSCDLQQVRVELDAKAKKIAFLMSQRKFGYGIERVRASVSKQVLDLHASICGTDTLSIRPLILALIFGRRFTRLIQHGPSDGLESVQVFRGREECAVTSRISEIRERFVVLSQELLVTKQALCDAQANLTEVLEERDIAQITLRSNNDEIKLNRKKMKIVRQRMSELQGELASLVSPEGYDEICERLHATQRQMEEIESKAHTLEQEIEARNDIERTMTSEVERLTAAAEQKSITMQNMRTRYARKEEEVESLKSLVREKTKELLGLERLVRRHREQESATNMTLNCLAVENREMHNTQPSKGPRMPLQEMAPVNPAFMGA